MFEPKSKLPTFVEWLAPMNGQASKRLRLLKQLLSWSIAAFSGGLLYKALQKWTESRKRIQDDSSSHEIVVEHSYLRKDHFFSFFFVRGTEKWCVLGVICTTKKIIAYQPVVQMVRKDDKSCHILLWNVTRIGKKRVAPSLVRKKKRKKSLQTSRSLVYQMTSSSLARNWMLVGKALFSGVKLRFLRFIKNTRHQ